MDRIPILRIGDVLLVTIQVDLHDELLEQLRDELATRIEGSSVHGVVIDVSSLDVIDTYFGHMLGQLSRMSHLLSTSMVLVGMRPAVAITLVELGMTLTDIRTALDVDRGLEFLKREHNRVG
jgi:rsbT antagonist protein RsbS